MPTLKVATDCSGIDTIIHALNEMNIEYQQLWYSDILPNALAVTLANGGMPEYIFTDILKRDETRLPTPDLYCAGCPCQPFSSAGSRKHSEDGRFNVFLKCIATIEACQPKCFIIENVATMDNKSTAIITARFSQLGSTYCITQSVLNTRDYGLPQNRARLYIVGIKRSEMVQPFHFPEKMPPVSLRRFLNLDTNNCVPQPMTAYMQGVVSRCASKVGAENFDRDPYVCNCGSSQSRLSVMLDTCPCLTRRSRPYIGGKYQRRLTTEECAQLQGFTSLDLSSVPYSSALALIGNAQSVDVLVAVLKSLLPAVGVQT